MGKLKINRISFRGFKTNHGMFIVKNFRVVYVKYVYYLTKVRDRNLEVNLLKLYFEMLVNHETKEYHKDVLDRKAKDFLESYEDTTKSVTHAKNSNEKYERNIHIMKIIIRAVLLCTEQGIALRRHREEDSSNDAGKNSDTERIIQRGNFLAINAT